MTPEQAGKTDIWLITYAAPILIAIFNIIMFLTVFREEPLDFLVKKNDKNKAL